MKKIAILGSTGSIGTQTLEVVRENQDIQVMALAAGSNIELLEAQIREFRPVLAAVWEEEKAKELRENIKDLNVKVVSGMDGLKDVAVQKDTEILVTAIVGMIGILPTIEGIRAGKNIALANKETLVTAGILLCLWQKSMEYPFFQWTVNTVRFSSLCKEDSIRQCQKFCSRRPADISREKEGRASSYPGRRCPEASQLGDGTPRSQSTLPRWSTKDWK